MDQGRLLLCPFQSCVRDVAVGVYFENLVAVAAYSRCYCRPAILLSITGRVSGALEYGEPAATRWTLSSVPYFRGTNVSATTGALYLISYC